MHSSPQNIALFNNSSMGIVVVNNEGIIKAINPFALDLFGYQLEEIIEEPIETLIPGRFHYKHIADRHGYMHNPRSRPMGLGMDLYAIKKDGAEFPVEVSLGNYQNNGDSSIIAFINDITIRKSAEREIQKLNNDLEATVEQRTKDLKEALHKLEMSSAILEDVLAYQKALLDNAGAMIIATNEKGVITLFNPEASVNLGYHESEIVNKTTPLIFHDKKDVEKKRKEFKEITGADVADDWEIIIEKSNLKIHEEEQYIFTRKDGSSFPVSVTLTRIQDKADQITGFMIVAVDITQRKKAEEDLKKALKKERDLNELKSNFVSMASHEFRTPLSTVLSSAYLIEKYSTGEDQPKRERHLERIVSSVKMLTDILNDFLSVGKIEEGKIQVRPIELNIETSVKTLIEEIKNNLKKQQEIVYRHEGDENIVLDPSLLKHIIMNLVSNASKFSPEGSRIEMKTSGHDDQLILYVKDNGIGISKEDQQHLMERFFRASNAGNIQGTGLGLHNISKYVELMNGSVSYKSELEKGTEFIITFNL